MSHIDRATGRNKREAGKLAKPARAGAIKRRDGKPAEKRVDQKRRAATGRKEISDENGRRAEREKGWARTRSQVEQRRNSWWN